LAKSPGILQEYTDAEEVALIRFDPMDEKATLRYIATKQGEYSYAFENNIALSRLLPALEGLEQAGHLILSGDLLAKNAYTSSLTDPTIKGVSSLCLPLSVPGEVHGLLVAVEADRPGRSQRIELLKAASLQIASGIQNYITQTVQHKQTLIDRELQLAGKFKDLSA